MSASLDNRIASVTNLAKPSSVDMLTPNCIYQGVVIKVDVYRGMMDVAVGHAGILSDCRYAPGALASVFGVTSTSLPPVGATVLLVHTGQNNTWVIGTTSNCEHTFEESKTCAIVTGDENIDAGNMPQLEVKMPEEGPMSTSYPAPTDILPGEQEWSTGTGVVMRMLMGFAQLNAGDLAKIEVHLLNDMVRIVSNYFVHHSCGGDELIWSAGRPTKEVHFTSYDFEAEGKEKPEDELAQVENAAVNFDELQKDASNATGRWRLSEYYGFLGDMVHRFVTTPTEVASNIMENSFRAGQYRSWVGSDGTLLIQSAGGVHVEVTQYIVIPSILKQWNDPEFDCQEAMKDLDDEFLQVWGSGPDWTDMKYACWQLRYYLKYITLYHSLARFHQMEKKGYCKLPTEKDAPERKATAGQEDVELATPAANYRGKGHAAFVMDAGGSVSLISNGNTSVIMNQGNIQIACPGNLELKVGGNISMTGKNVAIHATHIMEIISFFGSLTLKARTLWQALCEAGTLWLKGDAKYDGSSAEEASEAYPLDDTAPEAHFEKYSVVIDASQGKTLVHGAKGAVLGATDKEAGVYVQASGADSDVFISSNRHVIFKATQNIVNGCISWINDAVKTYIGSTITKIGDYFAVSAGIVACRGIQSNTVSSRSIVRSTVERTSKEKYEDLPDPDKIIRSDAAIELSDEAHAMKQDYLRQDYQADYKSEQFNGVNWELPDWSLQVGKDLMEYNSYKASPLDDMAADWNLLYDSVTVAQTRLLAAPRTVSENLPFPGREAIMFSFDKGKDKTLVTPWEQQFTSDMIATTSDFSDTVYTMYFPKEGMDPNEPLFTE